LVKLKNRLRHFSEMKVGHIVGKPALRIAGLLIFCVPLFSQPPQQGTGSRQTAHSAHNSSGQHLFATTCAACHGLDGMGSERAPNIVTNPQVQKLSAAEISRIVSTGVPGTGMPAFQRLGKPAIASVVTYLRDLQGKNRSAPLPGDPQRGEALFFGSAQCSNCHMASGRGGFIAPDLTTYGQTHTADATKSSITNPAERDSTKAMVTAIAVNGDRYQGIVRNEDNFSLQLQSTDGAFHFLSKADLQSIDRSQGSMMPSDYASRLTVAQLNDLVSYLLSLEKTSLPIATRHADDE
jgi:cytochrome c oxidase cbb3-type subunit III